MQYLTDQEIVEKIVVIKARTPFRPEGYRKVWARLRHEEQIRVGPARVLRLMRENSLLAPREALRSLAPRREYDSIIPSAANLLWGMDSTVTATGESNASIYFAIDHFNAEVLSIVAAASSSPKMAVEALRDAVLHSYGSLYPGIAKRSLLSVRHDHGPCFVSEAFQNELRHFGIFSSPIPIRTPQRNGCAERFVRTLKQEVLSLTFFDTVDRLQSALTRFVELYNSRWILHRHGGRPPLALQKERGRLPLISVIS